MRHQKNRHRLGRTASHRSATLAALSNALIKHKRITTTVQKAKALRVFVEPIINRTKEDNTANRRQAFRHLQDKESIKELFGDIAEKVADRQGGYTRIIKLGARAGDSAELAMIELVDYNDVRPGGLEGGGRRRRTRRSVGTRRKRSGEKTADVVASVPDESSEADVQVPETVQPEEAGRPVEETPGNDVGAETPADDAQAEAAADEPISEDTPPEAGTESSADEEPDEEKEK